MATSKKTSGSKSRTQKNKSSSSATTASKSKTARSKSKKASTSKTVTAKTKKSSGAKGVASASRSATSKAKSTKKTASKSMPPASKRTTAKKATSAKSKSQSSKGIIATAIDAVTGIFKPGAPDATDVLKADHRKVEELFERVKANPDGNNLATFKKIKQELEVHTHIEETVFYPFLLERGDAELKKIVREGIEEHGQVKDLLVELADLDGDSPTFKAKLTVVMENVEHHVEEEEDEMFPMVENQFDDEILQRLGSLLKAEKVRVGAAPLASKRKASAAGTR
jgi:iron-sulfur cluster repair protein YtfE (RIC family)